MILKPQVSKVAEPALAKRISGKEFILAENDYQIQSVYFAFKEGECSFAVKRNNQVSVIKAGLGSWKLTNSKTTSLLAPPRPASKSIDANYAVLQPVIKVGTSYFWSEPNTLEITARFIEESLGTQAIVCRFSETGGAVGVNIGPKSAPGMMGTPGRAQPPAVQLRGTLVKLD